MFVKMNTTGGNLLWRRDQIAGVIYHQEKNEWRVFEIGRHGDEFWIVDEQTILRIVGTDLYKDIGGQTMKDFLKDSCES